MPDDWQQVIWTDECAFNVGTSPGHVYVTRRADKEYDHSCLVPRFPKLDTIHVWGCFMGTTKGPLIKWDRASIGQDYQLHWVLYLHCSTSWSLLAILLRTNWWLCLYTAGRRLSPSIQAYHPSLLWERNSTICAPMGSILSRPEFDRRGLEANERMNQSPDTSASNKRSNANCHSVRMAGNGRRWSQLTTFKYARPCCCSPLCPRGPYSILR